MSRFPLRAPRQDAASRELPDRAPAPRARRLARWALLIASAGFFALPFLCRTAGGDDAVETPAYDFAPSQTRNPRPPAPPSRGIDDSAAGVQFRGAHIEGQGVPQVRPITPLELFPYYLVDDSLFFSDLRFFPTNDGTFGGNIGVGYRYYSSDWDRVFGASFWYDADDTRNPLYFQQLGLSLETYAGPFDFRTNFYLPIGNTEQLNDVRLIPGSARFVGENIVFDQARLFYGAMKGLDMEAGIPLPGEFSDVHGLRAYGGWYTFDGAGRTITGGSARLTGNIIAGLDAQVQVTYDDFFQARAFVGISWTFGALHRSELPQTTAFGRIGEHVTRNYTVLATSQKKIEQTTAINPATGAPYRVAHVSSAAGGAGDGSVGNPFQTIAAGQAAGRDFVFVHAGSVFTGANASVVLNPGDRIFGDGPGVQHYIPIPQFGQLLVPHGPTAGPLPVLSGAPGDSVVLASNSEIAGFSILNPVGSGIVGDGISGAVVRSLSVTTPGADGLRLLNGASADISDLSVFGAQTGILVQNGAGRVRFIGTTTVSGSIGPAIAMHDLAAGADVAFGNLVVDHRQGRGLEIDNVAGNVSLTGLATITNEDGSTASALDIRNSSGRMAFNGVDVIGATGAPGVNLQDNTGTTSFETININSTGGTALAAHNAGILNINPTSSLGTSDSTKGGNITAVNGQAIDISDTELHVNLTSVSASNTATGVSLVDTTGLFQVFGTGSADTGGVIKNTTTGIFLNNVEGVGFQWLTLDGNGTGIVANKVSSLAIVNSTIKNSTNYGLEALDVANLFVATSAFTGNGAGNIHAQFATVQTYGYTLSGNQFTSGAGENIVLTALASGAGSTLNLALQQNDIENTFAGTTALKVDWNGGLAANINATLFTTGGGSGTGLWMTNASTTALSTIAVTNSGFHTTGSNDTALRLQTAGPSQISLVNNDVQFDATGSTGFRMSLAASANVNIAGNIILDTTDGGTGMLFDSVVGPGVFRIENNVLDFHDTGALTDRGIIFSSITNTIQLQGSGNNQVINADTPFFAPIGTTSGSIFVNGSPVP